MDSIPPVGLNPYWNSTLEQGTQSWKARRARQAKIISVEAVQLEPVCLQTQTWKGHEGCLPSPEISTLAAWLSGLILETPTQ